MLYPQMNKNRNLYFLDGIWEFYKDSSDIKFDSDSLLDISKLSDQRHIAVPASWNDQYQDLFQFHGKGWYERKFFIPDTWCEENLYIRFGSVSGKAKIWINGNYVAEHIGTALPFEANITKYIEFGAENVVTVLADNTLDPWALPPATLMDNEGRMGFSDSYPAVTYDFFPFGGIQRSVYVYTSPKVRIEDITIKTKIIENDAIISFQVDISDSFLGKLNVTIADKKVELICDNDKSISGEILVENALLWDIGQPNLYELEVELITDKLIDSYIQKFGIREIKIINCF